MKRDSFYSLVLLLSILILNACGTDNKSNPIKESEYTFFNATTPLIVSPTITVEVNATTGETNTSIEGDKYTIAVQLLKRGLIQQGETVQMLAFDLSFGFVTDLVTETTTNGYAVFEYHTPENYSAVKGQEITIQAIFIDPEKLDEDTSVSDATLVQDFLIVFQ